MSGECQGLWPWQPVIEKIRTHLGLQARACRAHLLAGCSGSRPELVQTRLRGPMTRAAGTGPALPALAPQLAPQQASQQAPLLARHTVLMPAMNGVPWWF